MLAKERVFALEMTVLRTYREFGSIKKTAKHLRVSHKKVRQILENLGVEIKQGKNSTKPHKCNTCRFARADKCEYMNAKSEEIEGVLKEMKVGYEVEMVRYSYGNGNIPVYTVNNCPKYQKGDLGSIANA